MHLFLKGHEWSKPLVMWKLVNEVKTFQHSLMTDSMYKPCLNDQVALE